MKWALFVVPASLVVHGLLPYRAESSPPATDVFSATSPNHTNKSIKPKQPAESSNPEAIVNWFEKFDKLKDQYYPTTSDKVVLSRPLMQEAERVKQWINVASKVSRNYMLLAKSVKTLPVPPGAPEVKNYRDLTADWYEDTSHVFDDLIKPRPAAKTIEALQRSLREIKDRSKALDATSKNLEAMDQDIRKQYNVHPDLKTDALQQYVRSN